MSKNDKLFICLGAAFAGLAVFVLANQDTNRQEASPIQRTFFAGLNSVTNFDVGPNHLVHPWYCPDFMHTAGTVSTPHRYPTVTGGNISSLIHKGFDSMRCPPQQDASWLCAPPSEEYF